MLIQVSGSGQLKQLAKRFRAASNGKVVRTALTKGIKVAAKDAVDELKSNYRTMHVTSEGRSHGRTPPLHAHALRANIARQVKISVRYSGKTTGVRVFVDAARMPEGQQKLPHYLERPKGWRHPVLGHRDRWVSQHGTPTFQRTLQKHTPRVREATIRAVNEALKELR